MPHGPLWFTQPVKNPSDGDVVWVRRTAILTAPFQAQWRVATQDFLITTVGTGDPPTTLPWWAIQSWRPV
jgi:hypothetical protein